MFLSIWLKQDIKPLASYIRSQSTEISSKVWFPLISFFNIHFLILFCRLLVYKIVYRLWKRVLSILEPLSAEQCISQYIYIWYTCVYYRSNSMKLWWKCTSIRALVLFLQNNLVDFSSTSCAMTLIRYVCYWKHILFFHFCTVAYIADWFLGLS